MTGLRCITAPGHCQQAGDYVVLDGEVCRVVVADRTETYWARRAYWYERAWCTLMGALERGRCL